VEKLDDQSARFPYFKALPPISACNRKIAEIYAGVRPDYRKYIDEYRAKVVAQAAKVMAHCPESALSASGGGEASHAVVIPNL